jgi:hypothetical protein
MAVAVKVCPDGGVCVQIGTAAMIPEDGSLPACDDDWLRFEPILHLRERMPDIFLVELGEFPHGGDGMGFLNERRAWFGKWRLRRGTARVLKVGGFGEAARRGQAGPTRERDFRTGEWKSA